MSFFEILRVVKVMVGVVHPELGKRVARILVAIRQSTIYPPPLPQSYMVHTILVVLHYYILVIGWYFYVENVGIPCGIILFSA
jgi:hypothetical protein